MKSYNLLEIAKTLARRSTHQNEILRLVRAALKKAILYKTTTDKAHLISLFNKTWALLLIDAEAFFNIPVSVHCKNISNNSTTIKCETFPSLINFLIHHELHREIIAHLSDALTVQLRCNGVRPVTLALIKNFTNLLKLQGNDKTRGFSTKNLQKLLNELNHHREKAEQKKLKHFKEVIKYELNEYKKLEAIHNILSINSILIERKSIIDQSVEKKSSISYGKKR